MCGRFAAQLPPEFIQRLFRTSGDLPNIDASWNVAPTDPAMVVRLNKDTRERNLDVLRWGLVPFGTKDVKKALRPINARAETVTSAALFRMAFAKRRCIVPADAFYEWHATAGDKQPYAVGRQDRSPLALAAVWESWRDPHGEILRSFAILTTAANSDLSWLHPRMPVILEEEDWRTWLGEVDRDPASLLRPSEAGVLRSWPVSRAVNSVRNNDASLLQILEHGVPQAPTDQPAAPNPA